MLLIYAYCNGKMKELELDSSTEHMHASHEVVFEQIWY